jgi:hypothetical protein
MMFRSSGGSLKKMLGAAAFERFLLGEVLFFNF